jgi:hypothetical protein
MQIFTTMKTRCLYVISNCTTRNDSNMKLYKPNWAIFHNSRNLFKTAFIHFNIKACAKINRLSSQTAQPDLTTIWNFTSLIGQYFTNSRSLIKTLQYRMVHYKVKDNLNYAYKHNNNSEMHVGKLVSLKMHPTKPCGHLCLASHKWDAPSTSTKKSKMTI